MSNKGAIRFFYCSIVALIVCAVLAIALMIVGSLNPNADVMKVAFKGGLSFASVIVLLIVSLIVVPVFMDSGDVLNIKNLPDDAREEVLSTTRSLRNSYIVIIVMILVTNLAMWLFA